MKLFKIAVQLLKEKKSVKQEIYSRSDLQDKQKKHLFKIIVESIKFSQMYLDTLLLKIPKLKLSKEEMAVYLWEYLLGSKKILSKEILKNKTRIQAEFTRILMAQSKNKTLEKKVYFKYLRINTLKTTKDQVLEHFKKKGFHITSQITDSVRSMALDEHLEFLLKVNSRVDLSRDEFYTSGRVIFQDKASCFSAKLLLEKDVVDSGLDFTVIDATAAPGNKTSHLSMIMENKGRIFAFERDFKRFKTLEKMLGKAGVENTLVQNMDFLTVNPEALEYRNVKYILLDPSCSGSGIVSRLEFSLDTPKDSLDTLAKRLESLSNFQKEIILHAFKFPSAQRVVYSTCSIHREENEDVVGYILENQTDFVLEENVFPEWKRRGLDSDGFDKGIFILFTSRETFN